VHYCICIPEADTLKKLKGTFTTCQNEIWPHGMCDDHYPNSALCLAEKAIEKFQELLNQKDLEPHHITFVGVLSACSHGGMVELGNQYFRYIKQTTFDHYACLISLFARAGRLKEALDLVEEIHFEANEIIWTSILAACNTYGNVELGEYCARKLLELDPKDPGTCVPLSNIYAAAGRWEDMRLTKKLMKSLKGKKAPWD